MQDRSATVALRDTQGKEPTMAGEFKSTATDLEFTDISGEKFREYTFPGGDVVRIDKPQKLAVTDGGHRVFDAAGVSHYLPRTFIHLRWEAFDGQPNFVR